MTAREAQLLWSAAMQSFCLEQIVGQLGWLVFLYGAAMRLARLVHAARACVLFCTAHRSLIAAVCLSWIGKQTGQQHRQCLKQAHTGPGVLLTLVSIFMP
jgi:hypothetical protein